MDPENFSLSNRGLLTNFMMFALEKTYSIYVSTNQPIKKVMMSAPDNDSSNNNHVTKLTRALLTSSLETIDSLLPYLNPDAGTLHGIEP